MLQNCMWPNIELVVQGDGCTTMLALFCECFMVCHEDQLVFHSIRLCTSPFRFVHGLLVGIKKVNSRANYWTFVNILRQ